MKTIVSLFITFMKIGAFTFGGGYAMIPIIQREIVEKKKWISEDEMLEIIAISESTPGPMAINSATFVGYNIGGFFGALAATLGVVIPSFIIILVISGLLNLFKDNKIVKAVFAGIRLGVLALLIKTFVSLIKKSKHNFITYFILAGAFIAVAVFDVNAIFVILVCAFLGILFMLLERRREL